MIQKILNQVFNYKKGDNVVFIYDLLDNGDENYEFRVKLAKKWHSELEDAVLAEYKATGQNNGDFPPVCIANQVEMSFDELFSGADIVIALTEYSATAPLYQFSIKHGFRAASMPGFNEKMMPAMEIDLAEIKYKVGVIYNLLDNADDIRIVFDDAVLYLDLRGSKPEKDDGTFEDTNIINLPTGEAFVVPKEYESNTSGELIIEGVRYQIENNRIISASEETELMKKIRKDPVIGNIAEAGFGVLGAYGLEPIGRVLLDEKLGLHIALGRSEHLGGKVSPKDFKDPNTVWHQDYVYLNGIKELYIGNTLAMKDSRYFVF